MAETRVAERRRVRATRAQERRRRLAFALDRDPFNLPDWAERLLCIVVGRGHTPIWYYGLQCAWCDANVPDDSPDTMPRERVRPNG